MLEKYQRKEIGNGDPDERALMKYLLPQFNLGSMYLNKKELKELIKKLKDTPSPHTFINNIFVLEILQNKKLPNTDKLELIMFKRRKLMSLKNEFNME